MPTHITLIATDETVRDQLVAQLPSDEFAVVTCSPSEIPAELPQLFIIALPGLETAEEACIEQIRADNHTADIPIVIVSALPMVQLQSVPYASDWTIAIVEAPVDPAILLDTIQFLLHPQ